MIPANLLRGTGKQADYLITGSWSKSAIAEATKEGKVVTAWDGKSSQYSSLPGPGSYQVDPQSAFLYYCSNETIQGVQFQSEPECPAAVPLVCDCSSDFLSRPLEVNRYGILYACAQKNAGPAGVTVAIVRKDLLTIASDDLPGYFLLRNHAENDSEWNTPPTFAIYVMGLVAKWLRQEIGGLAAMAELNRDKAKLLYDVIDQYPEVYQGHAERAHRSHMNVTFRLPDEAAEKRFLAAADALQLGNLKGHRSVGGIRASIYNAMPRAGVACLADCMRQFATKG